MIYICRIQVKQGEDKGQFCLRAIKRSFTEETILEFIGWLERHSGRKKANWAIAWHDGEFKVTEHDSLGIKENFDFFSTHNTFDAKYISFPL